MIANRLIKGLSDDDQALIEPLVSRVAFTPRQVLETPHQRVETAYFLDDGFASVTVGSGSGGLEIAMIGREGFIGVCAALDPSVIAHQTRVHGRCSGWRIPILRLRDAMDSSSSLRRSMMRYARAYVVQLGATALAGGRYPIVNRIARWICMVQDRVDEAKISVTQEQIAERLGVRRPGVTLALDRLASSGSIQSERGRISVLNRETLEGQAGGCYGTVEINFRREFG